MAEQPNLRIANLKIAVNVFLRTIFSAILAIIVYMSLIIIGNGFFTQTVGERLVEYDEAAGTTTILSEIYYSNTTTTISTTQTTAGSTTPASGDASTATGSAGGTDSTAAGGAAAGESESDTSTGSTTTTLPSNQRWEPIRTEIPASTETALNVISQILMLLLLVSLPYSKLWMLGDRDSNAVQFGHMAEDKLRGLKIGAMAGVPYFILYILLFLSKLGLLFPNFIFVYRLTNLTFLPTFNELIGASVRTTVDVSWFAMFILLLTVLVVPFVCWLAYLLGYKHISLSEKFIYVNPKKKKKRRR